MNTPDLISLLGARFVRTGESVDTPSLISALLDLPPCPARSLRAEIEAVNSRGELYDLGKIVAGGESYSGEGSGMMCPAESIQSMACTALANEPARDTATAWFRRISLTRPSLSTKRRMIASGAPAKPNETGAYVPPLSPEPPIGGRMRSITSKASLISLAVMLLGIAVLVLVAVWVRRG